MVGPMNTDGTKTDGAKREKTKKKKTKKECWAPIDACKAVWESQYFVPNFISRSVALRVEDDHWLIYSPGVSNLETFAQVVGGAPQVKISLLLPNHYHHMGTTAWLKQYPHAKVYCSSQALRRLKKRGYPVLSIEDSVEDNKMTLPPGFSCLIPEGQRWGEVWLSGTLDRGDRIWVTCDTFFNYSKYSSHLVARTLQKLFSSAPGLRISALVKWALISDRRTFGHWVQQKLRQDQPSIIAPSHGEVYRAPNLTDQLTALVSERLGV